MGYMKEMSIYCIVHNKVGILKFLIELEKIDIPASINL